MKFLLLVLALAIGALGILVLVTLPLHPILAGTLLVLAGQLLVGAAIVEAVNRVERALQTPPR